MKISRSFRLPPSGRGAAVRWLSSAFAVSLLVAACGDNANDSDSNDDSSDTGGSQNGSGGDGQGSGGEPGSGGNGTSGGTTGSGGGDEGGAGGEGGSGPLPHDCATTIAASDNSYVELCAIDGEVQHVRIEGLLAPRSHASTQVLFGYAETPDGAQAGTGPGEFKALFYGGGMPYPTPQLMGTFGPDESTLDDNATYLNTASTTCFDLHRGSTTTPPHFIVWVDGQNGADCEDFSSLTLDNAVARELWWDGEVSGAINPNLPVYFYQSAQQEATVTLFDAPALEASEIAPFECSQTVAADQNGYVELCQIDAPARHVKIEGLATPLVPPHRASEVLFGFDAAPTPPVQTLEADQFQVLFYGGDGDEAPTQIQAKFGDESAAWGEGTSFLNTEVSTVCFDVHDGSATTAPYFILWVDGQKGADCDDRDTLSFESAFSSKILFSAGAVDKAVPVFFRQTAAQAATVTVSSRPVITSSVAATSASCTTTWATNNDWQELCQPLAGPGRHFRLVDAAATVGSRYFYLVLAEPTGAPSGNPSAPADSGTFVFTGGQSNGGPSWTFYRFDGASTTQYDYGLYTPNPSTVCLDMGKQANGNIQFRVWATGYNGADCADRSTLTATSVRYSSVTQDTGLWGDQLGTSLHNYIKTSNTGASIGSVVVSSELAVP